MQSSNSFSDSRSGKPRPANLFSSRPEPSESLPWPSPSFNASFVPSSEGDIIADPGRPSSQIKSASPNSGLPPTPVTATYKHSSMTENSTKGGKVRLPGVGDLLGDTPPPSGTMATVDLPPPTAASERMLPPLVPHSARSTSGHDWPSTRSNRDSMRRSSMPVSPNSFLNMPKSSEVHGLGLDLGEETPKLGDWEMSTPTMGRPSSRGSEVPGAPVLTSTDTGRFSRFPSVMTSPIRPPLRNWNTNLFGEGRQTTPLPPPSRFAPSNTHSAPPMEREKMVSLEGDLPRAPKTWGLALSFDDGRTFKRGRQLYNEKSIPLTASAEVDIMPPTPTHASSARKAPRTAERPTPHREGSNSSSSSLPSPITSRAPMHASKSTGLTPHIHKTRLTPTLSASKKASSSSHTDRSPSVLAPTQTTATAGSPSLKMRSKQRSELLRSQVAAVAAAKNLPADHVWLSSPMSTQEASSVPPPHRGAIPSVAGSVSPRKRGLSVRDTNVSRSESSSQHGMQSISSPWGVFELGSDSKTWQPLGPPSMAKSFSGMEVDEEDADRDADVASKKKTKGGNLKTRSNKAAATSDVFGSKTVKGKHVASMSGSSSGSASSLSIPSSRSHSGNSSPSKTSTRGASGQRRLVNLR